MEEQFETDPWRVNAPSAATKAESLFRSLSYYFFSHQDLSRVLFPDISNLTEALIE